MGEATTVRDVVYSLLRALGIDTVFGNPGSTELPMFRDFPDDFRYVLGLQESTVVAMADGYAQARRGPALVSLHSAAGLGHALGNIFTASKNQTPLVIIAGQQARSILPFDPFLHAREATEFPKPYVKWSCEPARAENVPAAIAHACYLATQPPRGPVFVSVPVDDWDRPCAPLAPRRVSRQVQGDASLLAETAAALNRAQRPALVVGAAVARDRAWRETIALAERHSAAVWAAPMAARNSFPEQHPLFAGFLAADRNRIVSSLDGHDLILVLGAPVFSYHIEGTGPYLPAGASLVQLTDDPDSAARSPVGTSVVTSLRAGVAALLAASEPGPRQPPARAPRAPQLDDSRLTDAYLLQQIARHRGERSIIVEEAPSSRAPMHDYLPILEEDGFYTCASGGLGFGLPAAVGVALGRPSQHVIAVLGDGSSMYSIQGLWSAAQLHLPISFIVIRNGGYEALNEFGRYFRIPHIEGLELPQIDFCALARGLGLAASSVRTPAELNAALPAALASSAPTLLEVIVEPQGTAS